MWFELVGTCVLDVPRLPAATSRRGLVTPEPKKRPNSSYIRFQASMPDECWQADFTHYRLARSDGRAGLDTEILTWLDDHSDAFVEAYNHHRPARSLPQRATPATIYASRPKSRTGQP